MNLLGIDYGEKRIGLSYADSSLGIAVPIPPAIGNSLKDKIKFIAQVIQERKINAIVIGYPLTLKGEVGPKAKEVDQFIKKIEGTFDLPIYKADERYTSVQATEELQAFGMKKKKSIKARKNYRASGDLDSRAAAIILQGFLEKQSDL